MIWKTIAAEVWLQNDLFKRGSPSHPGCNKLPFDLSKCIKIWDLLQTRICASAEGILILVFSQAAGSEAAAAAAVAQKERKRLLRADGWHHTLRALCQLAHNPQDTAKSQMMSEQIRRQHASLGRSGLGAVHDQRTGGGGKKEEEEGGGSRCPPVILARFWRRFRKCCGAPSDRCRKHGSLALLICQESDSLTRPQKVWWASLWIEALRLLALWWCLWRWVWGGEHNHPSNVYTSVRFLFLVPEAWRWWFQPAC